MIERKPAIRCQAPRGQVYTLAIDGIVSVEESAVEDILLVWMSRGSAAFPVVGRLPEFVALLPADHPARPR